MKLNVPKIRSYKTLALLDAFIATLIMIILYINLSTVTISFLLLSEIFYHILLKSIKNKTDLQKGKKSIANFRICDIIDKYLMIYFRRKRRFI